MKMLALAFLLGLLSACGFAPLDLWPLSLLCLAALLWLVERAPHLRSALARGWWFGVGHFTLGLNWIATAFTYQAAMPAWLGWVAVFLLSLYLAVYPAMACGLAWRWGRSDRLRFVLLFAAAWIVTEWLRATMFTGFAWNPAGVTLLPTRFSDAATLLGTYGLSGFAMLLAGALLLLSGRAWRPAAALLGAVAVVAAIGFATRGEPRPGSNVALRIVQPNIGQQDKWREGFEEQNYARLEKLSRGPAAGRRLLLWPEAAVTDPLQDGRRNPFVQRRTTALQMRVGRLLAPGDLLLTGGVTLQSADGSDVTSGTNSVFMMDADGRILGRYDKAHLVPYGEYLPARPILSAIGLSRLAPGDVDFAFGPGPQTFPIPGVGKVGFQLCYEIIFSGEVVDRRNRPDVIFNPSNDAWFGAWGPPQHLAQAQLRALEEGLPVLRSTPTGISAVIGADGRLIHSLPWRTSGVIDAALPPSFPPTLFASLGNFAAFIFASLLVAIAIAVSRKAR